MNINQTNQVILNIKKSSLEYSQGDLEKVISLNPYLTSYGLFLPESQSFQGGRDELLEHLNAFQLSCAYLSLCQRSKRPCKEAFHSGYLKHHVERLMKTYVPSGCVVAACDCLGIKYWSDPENTPYIKPYIKAELPVPVEAEYLV